MQQAEILAGMVCQQCMNEKALFAARLDGSSNHSEPKHGVQVSDRDDRLLTEQMLALETANQEVAGDEDSEEEEIGMGDVDVESPPVVAA